MRFWGSYPQRTLVVKYKDNLFKSTMTSYKFTPQISPAWIKIFRMSLVFAPTQVRRRICTGRFLNIQPVVSRTTILKDRQRWTICLNVWWQVTVSTSNAKKYSEGVLSFCRRRWIFERKGASPYARRIELVLVWVRLSGLAMVRSPKWGRAGSKVVGVGTHNLWAGGPTICGWGGPQLSIFTRGSFPS